MAIIVSLVWLAGDAVMSRIHFAYERGYKDGLAAKEPPVKDNVCITWLFNQNLKEAKKRICSK